MIVARPRPANTVNKIRVYLGRRDIFSQVSQRNLQKQVKGFMVDVSICRVRNKDFVRPESEEYFF